MTAAELKKFYFEDLHWCGCGDPWGALEFMGEALEAIDARLPDAGSVPPEVWDRPMVLLGMEQKPALAWSYLYMLDAYDLTEHGSGVRGCWLTEKGRAVLQAIQACDEDQWERADPWNGTS